MDTFFCFSDECGDYKRSMTQKQVWKHPFYIRSTLIIKASDWRKLNTNFRELKDKFSMPHFLELKWADLWSLRHFQKNNKPIPERHRLYGFREHEYKLLIDFVEQSLLILNDLEVKSIIITYTKNVVGQNTGEKAMLSMHLQEHMQRIEMELQNVDENLGVLFFDPVSKSQNEYFREIYYELFENGDYINEYSHIKDSLNIENSHHSVGIQIADYVSGSFSALVKSNTQGNYDRGVKMFFDSVFPNLRRGWQSQIQGYGIREVPSNRELRKWMIEHLKKSNPNLGRV
ncbi:DUF3800 domain-containing protein [Flavobacteriaceae bacterium AH-315-B10]|nr:DUF3800 domain-containing protein [Flavobacteriaceae bacterium AH-315-B10]